MCRWQSSAGTFPCEFQHFTGFQSLIHFIQFVGRWFQFFVRTQAWYAPIVATVLWWIHRHRHFNWALFYCCLWKGIKSLFVATVKPWCLFRDVFFSVWFSSCWRFLYSWVISIKIINGNVMRCDDSRNSHQCHLSSVMSNPIYVRRAPTQSSYNTFYVADAVSKWKSISEIYYWINSRDKINLRKYKQK